MMDRPPSYVSCATLARELDLSQSTVHEMARRGLLPSPVKLSSHKIFSSPRHGGLLWIISRSARLNVSNCALACPFPPKDAAVRTTTNTP